MFDAFRNFCERLLRIPPQPDAPPGDELSTKIFRASPNYLRYLKLGWALHAVVMIGVLGLLELVPLFMEFRKAGRYASLLALIPAIILVLVLVGQGVRLVVLQLDFEKRWYVVTNRSLRVREGVLHVREMTVTFANIQNISVSQGPVQRFFKIADLRVDTAGGGGAETAKHQATNLHTAWFRGIDNAEEVKTLIQARLRGLKDSGLGDHDDPRPAQPASDMHITTALREALAEACALRAAISNR